MNNNVIIAAISAWSLSQILKVVFGIVKLGRSDTSRISWRLIWAGGMPSSHSAFTVSTAVVIGLSTGFNSPLFGLSCVLAIVVIYDRSRMNHIYKTFQNRIPLFKEQVESDPILKDLVGHTLSEIVVGICIGLFVGITTFYALR